ncbi:ATP-binding protein [Streptomyces sp. TR06-5]|uniref:ATP-binding protein n=1 Tax=Streptomyces sp. TR06-5 TaxID=3385976 RepID=UPI0039A20B14
MASPHEALSPEGRAHPETGPLRDAFHLPAQPTAVADARRAVLDRLRSWGVDEEARADAELLVSELFTNAVRHTGSEKVGCEVRMLGVRLRLEVTDEGGRPVPEEHCQADAEGETGRGLLLVSVLADEWGVRPDADAEGHAVWAELPCVRTLARAAPARSGDDVFP